MNLLPNFASRGELAPLLNKIHHCDALELLGRLPDASVDMILCDLPYGVTACAWDEIIPLAPMWEAIKRVVKKRAAVVLTATEPFASKLRMSNINQYRYDWVWNKHFSGNINLAHSRPMAIHENVLVFSHTQHDYYPIMETRLKVIKGGGFSSTEIAPIENGVALKKTYDEKFPMSILDFPRDLGRTIHPTQKPVALFEYLIKTYTQAGDVVLDMCVGSGTTAVAARNLGRSFICGDSYLPYVEMARLRLDNTDPFQATVFKTGEKQLSLFSA